MSDIDLSVLGASPDDYGSYAEHISQEYSFVPAEIYNSARIGVLQMFLDRIRIYRTNFFHEKYEAQARTNLAGEIALLQNLQTK